MDNDESVRLRKYLLRLRREWTLTNRAQPRTVYLPAHSAQVLLDDLLQRIEDETEHKRISDLGLSAVYGGSVFGMEIRPSLTGHPEVGVE